MIEAIKMRSCATYDFEGASISNCQKINFIYGANGSGKSTISNFLQTPTDPYYSKSEIVWSSGTRSEIVVYNRRFREQNFSNSEIAGVFTLGQATIEEIHALEALKERKKALEKEYDNDSNSLENKCVAEKNHMDDFRDTIWSVILKNHDHEFQEAFSGLRNSKDKFRDEVIRRFHLGHDSKDTLEELRTRAHTLYSSKPESCVLIQNPFSACKSVLTEIENDDIWQKIVVGNNDIPIGKFIQRLNNADWVNQGRSYISEGLCPFCQQPTITDNFLEQLSQFFDAQYKEDVSRIATLMSRYDAEIKRVIPALNSLLENTRSIAVGGLDAEIFRVKISNLDIQMRKNLELFEQKKREPSRKFAINCTQGLTTELDMVIRTANEKIKVHNRIVDNYNVEKQKLTDDIWVYLLDEQESLIKSYLSDIAGFTKAKKSLQDKLKGLRDRINRLDNEILLAEKNITSVQPTVDEINRLLKAYGFENFKIAPSPKQENFYQIQRPDGTLASNTLSEGEETFIAFLYFMQLAKGATELSKVSSKRILVLDDPICSLDSTILYIVSAIVKDLIKEIQSGQSDVEQIFLFTHNVFFHKEVSFVNGRVQASADVNYWTIHKDALVSKIESYGQHNPISTSYELLWRGVRDNHITSVVTIQNTMRRIIENYFGMLGTKKYDYIVDKFETAEEKMICDSLFYWINDGSHSIPDDLYIDSYSDSVDKYKEIFRRVFVAAGHEAHYNMMMGIGTNSDSE